MPSTRVLVVGSCNVDLVWRGPRLPERGETVGDGVFARGWGGKGANLAAAAARLGATVSFVGGVGADGLGAAARADLEASGIDCRWLWDHEGVVTGTALINVDPAGDNTVTVAPGANALLGATQILAAVAGAQADVLVTGYEIGAPGAADAVRAARARGVRTICNPSPVALDSTALFADCSVVVVNELEAEAYGGVDAILGAGALEVVVTRGAAGAERHRQDAPDDVDVCPGFPIQALDSTGAGDAFCAALAVTDDLRVATAAGALACRAVGARASLPTRAEIDELLSAPPPPS